MNNKKISNKILPILLSSAFVFTNVDMANIFGNINITGGRVYAEEPKEPTKPEEKLPVIRTNNIAEKGLTFNDKGEAKAIIEGYTSNNDGFGYLMVDIDKDFVQGYGDDYISDEKKDDEYIEPAMTISTNFDDNGKYKPTIVREDYCEYDAADSDNVRFYLPYKKASGDMILTFKISDKALERIRKEEAKIKKENEGKKPEKQEREKIFMDVAVYSESIGKNLTPDNIHILNRSGNLTWGGTNNLTPQSGFTKIETYSDDEKEEQIYKGFIFDKGNNTIFIKPNSNANEIRLYLGAGENSDGFDFRTSVDDEILVRYYRDGEIYKKRHDGTHQIDNEDDDRFTDEEYKEEEVSLDSGFRSITLPWDNNNSIIELKLMHSNNFLFNIKVESLSKISSGGGTVTPVKPDDNNSSTVNASVSRISSSNRYKTAIDLSKRGFSKSKNAVIASGDNFADALSGGPLAAALDAPLLLVSNEQSDIDDVNRELRRLGVEKIYLLGGSNVIKFNTQKKLSDDGKRKVKRIEGKDRFETSYEVFKETRNQKDISEYPIMVNGYNFADALSAGPLAAHENMGILLTDGKNVPKGIDKNSGKSIIIGGLSSMDSSFKAGRISGKDRYDTAAQVAKRYFKNTENVLIASGEKYPDGLAAISVVDKYDAPLLLTPKENLSKATKDFLKKSKVDKIYVIGGNGSVSSNVFDKIKGL